MAGGKNSYLYANTNPITKTDKNGLYVDLPPYGGPTKCVTLLKVPTDYDYQSDTVWDDWGNWSLVNTVTMGGDGGAFWLVTRCVCQRKRTGIKTTILDVKWSILELCTTGCGERYKREYDEWEIMYSNVETVHDRESDIVWGGYDMNETSAKLSCEEKCQEN